MEEQDLIPHLFRTEFRKIASVLCKTFGIRDIDIAEDIASDTFLAAMETWSYKGFPENPVAWLHKVAKNKTINYLSRQKNRQEIISKQTSSETATLPFIDIDLSEKNINDSQLQMLFAICHPAINTESQIGLALRILCGFGIDEIAHAFLTNKETISKRLTRAKEKLRAANVTITFPAGDEITQRLDAVLATLYLLFNEGYYSETDDAVLRNDLCVEAMRLNYFLLENELTNKPSTNALMALMCFHSSRFDARKDSTGTLILYQEQDESLWNQQLIGKGGYYLHQSSQGDKISKYHLEASIAYWHTHKTDSKEKWENILQLFDQLLKIEYTPIAALNSLFALSKVSGRKSAIREAEKLNLENNRFYHALLGELYSGIDKKAAGAHFVKAIQLAKTTTDRQILQKKLSALNE